jgi:GntR family transcriptional repressor for pyruvate dehydrogenase complex
VGVAALAATRAEPARLDGLDELVRAMADRVADFPAYRPADVRFHIGLAEATGSARVVAAMTEVQGLMTDLIAHIAHPSEVLAHANAQHARLLAAVRAQDPGKAVAVMSAHLQGTEHVLAGLLPG